MMNSAKTTSGKKNLVLYFQVHQPNRLRKLHFFDIGNSRIYSDRELNGEILQRVAGNCYLPSNAMLLKLIRRHPGLKLSFSISGILLEQLEEFAPEVIDSFKALADTGSVEFLAETYYHSLACMMPGSEFEEQVEKHRQKIKKLFGLTPVVFRNTELIYNNDIGTRIGRMGFRGILTDGINRLLGNDSPHHLYEHPTEDSLKILLRNFRLSDDIAFRFSQKSKPLTAAQYMSWLEEIPSYEKLIVLAMDYETFGEHHRKESGIFTFMETWLAGISKKKQFAFMTPSEAVRTIVPRRKLQAPTYVSWADEERDLSAWLGNEMQRDAFDSVARLQKDVKALHDKTLLHQWRMLQTSDHFYYMSTKKGNDGGVHQYFSPYPSPYEAFINYMNVLTDFGLRVKIAKSASGLRKRTRTAPPVLAMTA